MKKTNWEQISGGCCLVVQLCPTLCNPMDCSTPGLPVPRHLLELAQVHVHCISNAVQHLILWHPLFFLLSMFLSIRVWLFTSGGQSIGALATVLPMNIQDQFRSPCCPRDSQESSPTPQFESVNSSELSLLYSPTLTYVHDYLKNYSFDYTDSCQQSDVSAF